MSKGRNTFFSLLIIGILVAALTIFLSRATPTDSISNTNKNAQNNTSTKELIHQLETYGSWEGIKLSPTQEKLWSDHRVSEEEKQRYEAELQERIDELNALGYPVGEEAAETESGITVFNEELAYTGPSIFTSGHGPEAILIDMNGSILHTWRCEFKKAFPSREMPSDWAVQWRYVHCFPNGDILAIFEGQGMVKLDKNSNILWTLESRAHHDLDILDNGDIYVLTRTARISPRINTEKPILEDYITLLDKNGNIKNQLSILDAFDKSEFKNDFFTNLGREGDITHINALECFDGSLAHHSPLFKRGNILTSIKQTHTIAIIDMEQGKVVWYMDGPWIGQHKPTLLDDGKIMIFNNNRFYGASSVLIFDPISEEFLWKYEGRPPESFYTKACGAAQPLLNGNILITESQRGRAFEITKDKQIVWCYINPFRAPDNEENVAYMYEMIRLPLDFPLDWTTAFENREEH